MMRAGELGEEAFEHSEKLANTKARVRDRGSQFAASFDHYNRHRPHRALQQRAPSPPATPDTAVPFPTANIIRHPRCDGLINEYENAA